MIQVLEERWRTARKWHWCSECGKEIVAGSRYFNATLKDDHVYHWKQHEACHHLAAAFRGDLREYYDGDEGWPPLMDDDAFRECLRLGDYDKDHPIAVARFRRPT